MKKIVLFILIISLIPILHAQQLNKVAVVSIYGNEEFKLDWRETIDIGVMDLVFFENSNYFSAKANIENFAKLILNELEGEFPFSFIDEQAITGTDAYMAYEPNTSSPKDEISVAIEGYKILSNLNRDNIPLLFESLPGETDAIMVVALDFDLSKDNLAVNTGTGGANAVAVLTMQMYDKSGKRIFNQVSRGQSKGKVKVRLNKVPEDEYQKLSELMNEASATLYENIKKQLPKRIQNMHKKLSK